MMNEKLMKVFVVAALLLFAALFRFLPHPPNFTPFIAMSLFAGSLIASPILALSLPVLAIFLSDLFLGLYPGVEWVYLSYAVIGLLGYFMRQQKLASKAFPVFVGSALSATLFFAISNVGVWLMAGLYPLTFAGLKLCFLMAIPFFPATLISTLAFSAVFFASEKAAIYFWPAQEQEREA